ncbi:cyclic lactone autoinducer peptide [Proteiniborus sp. MB09-C3]|nr:cyclic lactone autoinducer peptide [Proteiniborus sp. MB09-C3]WIV11589.1 cyclic lactone autoinducer peptide [Proteiniborus sp. MB09-C3]
MKAKTRLLNGVAAVAMTFANLGLNINCIGLLYQPKSPKK